MFGWKGRFSPWPEDNKATRAEGVRTGRFFSGHREAAQVLTPSSTVPCWWRTGRVNWLAGSIALARRIANLQDAALARASLLFGMDTAALPVWDEEDEAEQSGKRPYRYQERQEPGRARTHFIHRPARDIFPPKAELKLSLERLRKSGGAIRPGRPPPSSSGTACHQSTCDA